MITFYKDRNLTIPKPAIENSYVRINVKRFNISRRAISETTFRGISPFLPFFNANNSIASAGNHPIDNHIFRKHIKCFSCVFVSYALY
jgi:hypothetical protein